MRATLFVLLFSTLQATPPPPHPAPPSHLGLDPFYRQYLDAGGIPIVASAKVSPYALTEVSYLVDQLLAGRDDIRQGIAESGVRFAIMAPDEFTTEIPEHSDLSPAAYWDKRSRGLGATKERPAVSCGEENVLNYPGDPYAAESIVIHEFAHVIHQQGLSAVDPTFEQRLKDTFEKATSAGLWEGKYAGSNHSEYWAEAVQSWFGTNRENDHDHNHVDTREELIAYDPFIAKLCEEVFGMGQWSYQRLPDRFSPQPHLLGFDPSQSPTFAWPQKITDAFDAHEFGKGLAKVTPDPVNRETPLPNSPLSEVKTTLRVANKTNQRLEIFWIDYQGKRVAMTHVLPQRHLTLDTFAGHRFVLVAPKGDELASVTAIKEPGSVIISPQ